MSRALFLHGPHDARVAPFNLREGRAGETLIEVATANGRIAYGPGPGRVRQRYAMSTEPVGRRALSALDPANKIIINYHLLYQLSLSITRLAGRGFSRVSSRPFGGP